MLVFRYAKENGAEFISHLDTLRHLQKIVIRAKIPCEYSKGFNPHMQIFMSAPLGVGIKSRAEYCVLETNIDGESFKELFNKFSPRGFECITAFSTKTRPNIQAQMDSAEYLIKGINSFDVNEVLSKDEFFITDKKGEQKEVRNRILDLKNTDNGLIATLSFGNLTLRPDVLAQKLLETFGGENVDIVKTNAFIEKKTVEEALWG